MLNTKETQQKLGLRDHLTHKGNLKNTRYGWLRLTPAYSVHLVSDLLDLHKEKDPIVLDPFCGTGTTALVCAERGIRSDTTDINPFLVWLARVKAQTYKSTQITEFTQLADNVAESMIGSTNRAAWVPPLFQIEKWWDEQTLNSLSNAINTINCAQQAGSERVVDLLKVAFCRVMIERANVSFGHQSMSFKKNGHTNLLFAKNAIVSSWEQAVVSIAEAARSKIGAQPNVHLCDARHLSLVLQDNHYSCVITSPPYPNRMSYIRELRPYMYWLGYLENAREAGELDWKAIGGTWGCATSNVGKWVPENRVEIPYEQFQSILSGIAHKSLVLSRYVHKYFYDMTYHLTELFKVVRSGGYIHYIVGNSKFYDVMLPVEAIFAKLFEMAGFVFPVIKTIRKRTSKRELFEFVVSAQKT